MSTALLRKSDSAEVITLPRASPRCPSTHQDNGLSYVLPILDQVDCGIVLCSTEGGLLCNRAADQQLSKTDSPLRLCDGMLVASEPNDTLIVRRTIHDAMVLRRRRLIELSGPTRALAVAVVPVLSADEDLASPVPAILIIGRLRICSPLAAQWFGYLHRLTPTEAAVLSKLLEGHEPRTIAECHGVKMSTVRTQIGRIMDKTSKRCVRDLLIAVATLPPMMTVAGCSSG
jgi:DNA-binding CsgD family transcriptional regulator